MQSWTPDKGDTVVCDGCAFRMGAEHLYGNDDERDTCPVCAEATIDVNRQNFERVEEALAQWIEKQSGPNTATLYNATLAYFEIDPVIPD